MNLTPDLPLGILDGAHVDVGSATVKHNREFSEGPAGKRSNQDRGVEVALGEHSGEAAAPCRTWVENEQAGAVGARLALVDAGCDHISDVAYAELEVGPSAGGVDGEGD